MRPFFYNHRSALRIPVLGTKGLLSRMNMISKSLAAFTMCVVGLNAQQLEIGGFVGGQINGGVNYSTSVFKRADFSNALSYGANAGVALSDVVHAEFQWSRSTSDVLGVPTGGGASVKAFSASINQYSGNLLFHLGSKEDQMRPFVLVGMGAAHFSPNVPNTNGLTRPAMGFGGGLKYYLSKHAGLRLQARWMPINMYTTSGNTWCGPVTGCWSMGTDHYLHALEFTAGVGFRF